MNSSKKWEVLHKENATQDSILSILLENRGITKKEQEAFLHPDIASVTAKSVGIDIKQLIKTLTRLGKAKNEKEQIVVYGDYDVDGITGTAILWETLHGAGFDAMPFIPSRADEGYGLSIKGIEHVLSDFPQTKIIITVDNGIVATDAVAFANTKGIDVVITDHHTFGKKLPDAFSIVHTTLLCGAGVAWILSKELLQSVDNTNKIAASQAPRNDTTPDHLALVALATVADLVPLVGANRVVLTEGLSVLRTTKRPGIVALCEDANIDQTAIGVYEIGHMLAPRLNAMGRISSAMESLRLLCTKDRLKAKVLAEKHGFTNKDRQFLTETLSSLAVSSSVHNEQNILFVAHEQYEEGVIGLVAGKLVEVYYRPSIVIAKKEKVSKASARSIPGFNIIEFIRKGSHLLINAGGHPMAAGFTIATENIDAFEKFVAENATLFDKKLLEKKIKIDCELPLGAVSQSLFDVLQTLQPFGMGNPEPTFVGKVKIISAKQVGKEKNHVALQVQSLSFSSEQSESRSLDENSSRLRSNKTFSAIAFGMGDRFKEFAIGQLVDIVYTIDENEWNNKKSLQLKIRDMR